MMPVASAEEGAPNPIQTRVRSRSLRGQSDCAEYKTHIKRQLRGSGERTVSTEHNLVKHLHFNHKVHLLST